MILGIVSVNFRYFFGGLVFSRFLFIFFLEYRLSLVL